MLNKVLVGCDPEIFLTKDNKYVSGHDLIPGTKDIPYPVRDGMVQVDGTALEYGITPTSNMAEFVQRNCSVIATLASMVEGYNLSITPTVRYDVEYFKALPKTAKELGCNPDFNAWTGEYNPTPVSKGTMRTASGHIHIGWTENKDCYSDEHFDRCIRLVRELDYYLGLPSLDWDSDNKRRSLYGQAGAFRPKSYGAEYRVLSNAWCTSSELMERVFSLTQLCQSNLDSGVSLQDTYIDLARDIINNNNTNWKSDYADLHSEMVNLGIFNNNVNR